MDQQGQPTCFGQVFLPVEGGRVVVATYYHIGEEEITQVEREMVKGVMETLRPAAGGQVARIK